MSAANCVIFENTHEFLHTANIVQQLNCKGGLEVCNASFLNDFRLLTSVETLKL